MSQVQSKYKMINYSLCLILFFKFHSEENLTPKYDYWCVNHVNTMSMIKLYILPIPYKTCSFLLHSRVACELSSFSCYAYDSDHSYNIVLPVTFSRQWLQTSRQCNYPYSIPTIMCVFIYSVNTVLMQLFMIHSKSLYDLKFSFIRQVLLFFFFLNFYSRDNKKDGQCFFKVAITFKTIIVFL